MQAKKSAPYTERNQKNEDHHKAFTNAYVQDITRHNQGWLAGVKGTYVTRKILRNMLMKNQGMTKEQAKEYADKALSSIGAGQQ